MNQWIRAASFLHKAKSERMKTPDDSFKSLFKNEPEIKKVIVNRVDTKHVGNNCARNVLINNLLRGIGHVINSKENKVLHGS